MSPDAVAVRKIFKGIVKEAIRDMRVPEGKVFERAEQYILRGTLPADVRSAGYPAVLVDALRDAVVRSRAERSQLGLKILKELRDHWD